MEKYIKKFVYNTADNQILEYCFTFPLECHMEELAYVFISTFKLSLHLKNDLLKKLNDFVNTTLLEFYDSRVNDLFVNIKSNANNIEDITKTWEKNYREDTVEYSEKKCATDEELFAIAYHKLVHSPVLGTMLKMEHNYAKSVRERIKARDKQKQMLKDCQTEEMNAAVNNLNITTSEKSINDLVIKHFEHLSLLQGKWSSELDTMKEVQRREYREWVMRMLEEKQTNSLPSSISPSNLDTETIFGNTRINREDMDAPIYEESFTIHLGSQLKQMHNIRIMSSNVLKFCSVNNARDTWKLEPTPQSLQTALALYSNDLCGLVLLTDSYVDSYSKMLKDFTHICQCSTEFHFPCFEDQLEMICDTIKINLAVMDKQRKSSDSSGGGGGGPSLRRSNSNKNLQNGDVFITRHSNLSQVHVIFHIVSDDSLLSKEISSRHEVLLGLRNILKTACSNDITSLTIPLLLQYDMTEEMTVAWCTKRAELIFKCVKGFMIEMASWGGSDLKNLQFILPQGISNTVFQSLTAMLPNIFKLSNPLVLKSSSETK